MGNENDTEEVIPEETPEDELTPETDWEAEAKKARGIAQRLRTKLTKATETKKPVETKVEPHAEPAKQTQTPSELDETQLDYFDLKGYTDSDEVEIFHKVMLKTGMSMREVLKDDYALAKVKSLRDEKAVQKATPSSTKRTGAGATDNIDILYEKFERTGELPTDFEARIAVINRKAAKGDTSIPPWRR